MFKKDVFKKAGALLCDVISMPFRALFYDAKMGYELGKRFKSPLRGSASFIMCNIGLALSPLITAVLVENIAKPLPWFLIIPLTTYTIYAVAWEHPIVSLSRKNWERFPLFKKSVKKSLPLGCPLAF